MVLMKSASENWDGLYLALEMELGVYVRFYKALVQGCASEAPFYVFEKGNVTLIR